VSSGLTKVHQKALLFEVILGERKYVNVEVPRAIADLSCYNCEAPITDFAQFQMSQVGIRARKTCCRWSRKRPPSTELRGKVNVRS
jgi:hypothetical protein